MAYQNMKTLTVHHPLPPMASAVFALAVTILKWEQRKQTRRALTRLDAHLLADIGLTPRDAQCECSKPFWAE
jgi:uncharacterized protein YjiS (DUF1127 family)